MGEKTCKFLSRCSFYISGVAIAFGVMVLTGWILHLQRLKGLIPGQVPVKANTAVCFVLIGTALWLTMRGARTRFTKVLPAVLALFASLVGLLSFLEFWRGWDFGIDQLLFTAGPDDLPGSVRIALMSPISAADFFLLGIAVALLNVKARWSIVLQNVCAAIAAVAALFGVLDFVLDPLKTHTHIAPLTALILFLCSFAVLCARSETGLGALLVSDTTGGILCRRLLPAAILIPIVIAWLRWSGQRMDLFSDWTGVAVMTLSSGVFLAGLTVWTAIALDRIEMRRERAEESSRRLAAIVTSSNDAIIGKSLDGIVTSWNPGAQAIYGYSADEMIGQGLTRLIPPGRLDEFEGFLQRLRKGENVRHYETQRIRKDGQIISVTLSVNPIKDASGTVVGASTIARDISERKRTEQALANERRRFEAVLDSLPVMVCLLRPDHSMAFANHSFRRQFGEPEGRKCYEFCFGKTAPCEFCHSFDVLKNGRPTDWEVVTNDGRIIHAFDFPFADSDGSPLVLEMDIDVTEQKAAERKLREASRYTRSLIEASLDPLVTISKEGKITDVNEATEKATGLSRSELIGSDFSNYFTEPEKAREGYERVFAKGLVRDYALAIRSTTGAVMDVLYNATVFKGANGEVEGVFAAARDVTERKRAEEALRESESRYRNLTESLPQMIFVKDRNSQYVSCNRNFARSLGISQEAFAGKCDYDFFSRELADKYRADDQKVIMSGRTAEIEEEYVRQRKRMVVQTVKTPLRDDKGNVTGLLGIFWDITARKQAVEQVRRASLYTRSLIEASLDPLVTISEDGKITDVNEATEKATGIARDRLIGSDFSDYFTEPQKAREGYERVFAKGFVRDYPLAIRSTSGTVMDVLYNATVFKGAGGEVQGVFAAARDVTERKRIEQEIRTLNRELEDRVQQRTAELQASERSVRRKLESILLPEGDLSQLELRDLLDVAAVQSLFEVFYRRMGIPMFVLGLKGEVVAAVGWQDICMKFHRANPQTCKNCRESDLELGKGALPGQFKLYKCKNNMWDAATPLMLGERRIGTLFCGQFFFVDEPIDYGTFRAQAKTYNFDEKEYVAALERTPRLTRMDVDTALNLFAKFAQMFSQLNYGSIKLARSVAETDRANAQLAAANKELEAFTYSVSHDLRAPLRHISGFSKILSEEFAESLPTEAQHHVHRIQEGTRRMGQLVDDLLNLGRVGRKELTLQVAGIRSIADEVIKSLKSDVGDRKVEWKIGDLPYVECDTALLQQVFQNLLANALKFTRPRARAVIEIGQTQKDGITMIFVKDNGVGFSMKYADKLFGVFQRLHRSEDFEGTGVGLATVQRIIQKHGGRIWAEAELDKGASFYFTLGNSQSSEENSKAVVAGVSS